MKFSIKKEASDFTLSFSLKYNPIMQPILYCNGVRVGYLHSDPIHILPLPSKDALFLMEKEIEEKNEN